MGATKKASNGIERVLARCYQYERDALVQRLDPDASYTLAPHWRGHVVWARLARLAGASEIDPVRYVRWCLELVRVYPGAPPEPNQLLGRDAMRAYQDHLPKVRAAIELKFRIEADSANTRFGYQHFVLKDDLQNAQLAALGAGDIRLSPLFRFVFARMIGTPRALEIAEIYEQDALLLFSKNPEHYGAVYGASGHLPTDFAEKARWYYDALIRKFDTEFAGGLL